MPIWLFVLHKYLIWILLILRHLLINLLDLLGFCSYSITWMATRWRNEPMCTMPQSQLKLQAINFRELDWLLRFIQHWDTTIELILAGLEPTNPQSIIWFKHVINQPSRCLWDLCNIDDFISFLHVHWLGILYHYNASWDSIPKSPKSHIEDYFYCCKSRNSHVCPRHDKVHWIL